MSIRTFAACFAIGSCLTPVPAPMAEEPTVKPHYLVSAIAVNGPIPAESSVLNAEPRALIVEARDFLTDAVVSDVSIQLSLSDGSKSQATTDASGRARFSLPEENGLRFIAVKAARDGLVPVAAGWDQEASSPTPPDRFLLRMEKAARIGGRVVDQDGKPVSDASVIISVRKSYPNSAQRVDLNFKATKTDKEGRWAYSTVPDQPDSVEIGAHHPLYLTEQSTVLLEKFTPIAALRDGSAVLRLQRGTLIEGTVLSPEGDPVADAEVFYGNGRGYANAIPSVKTDDRGRFTFGIKPGTVSSLITRAPGYGPAVQSVKVGGSPFRVYLTLQPAHSFRGRVVDPMGKPIARAHVWAYWSGSEASAGSVFNSAIAHELTTDDNGRFDWKEAPGSGVHASVIADGFAGKDKVALASDLDQEIVLVPPTAVKGTVVDIETGQPVPVFSLSMAAAWKPGDPLIWQRGSGLEESAKKTAGSFEYTTSHPAHRYLVRVQAEGYLPEDSELFSLDGTARSFTFRLTKTEPIRGKILNPDGSPARDGFVYLILPHRDGWIEYLELSNDDLPEYVRPRTIHAKVSTDGRFSLFPQKENFALLALADTGVALVPRRELHGDDVLRLQPWARVTGTVTTEGKPAANLELQSSGPDSSPPVNGQPRLIRRYEFKTDADGRFELPRVMPGRLVLGRLVPNGARSRIWLVPLATVDVESGKTYDLRIGRSGSKITGQLVLPRTEAWMVRKAEIVPRVAKTDRPVAIGVEVVDEGRFRAMDLGPGDYALRIAIHEPPPDDSCGWGRLLGEYTHEFTVPEGTTASDIPLDLGTLQPSDVGGRPLQVGDNAPDFTIKTIEGKELTLTDLRGKYVLLDFWATWCAPCLAEMPNLQSVNDQFSKDPRFALISVSLDERSSDAANTVKALKLSWLQGIAGPDSPIVTDYGATAIPATFPISPDGKILARDFRGEKTKAVVAEALKRRDAADGASKQ